MFFLENAYLSFKLHLSTLVYNHTEQQSHIIHHVCHPLSHYLLLSKHFNHYYYLRTIQSTRGKRSSPNQPSLIIVKLHQEPSSF